MTVVAPVITSFYAGVLGVLAVILTIQVIVQRVQLGIEFGDGGKITMAQSIRAHANFIEHVPLSLLILAFAEVMGGNVLIIHGLGIILLLARLLSAIGLSRSLGPSFARQSGASATLLVIALASLYAIFLSVQAM